jgi:hypothetical protein
MESNGAQKGYRRIMVAGEPHDFPETMSEEEIAKVLQREYGKPEPIRSLGAPPGVRAAVGAATNEIDRLKTLQRFYPDAEPYGDDNFVITDPGTKRRRLYNEENTKIFGIPIPTAGDIASVGPEIAEAIGAGMGAAVGVLGAPFGGPILGAGAGGATARTLYEAAARQGLGTTESQSPLAIGLNTTGSIASNAAGQGFGGLLEKYGLPAFEASSRYIGGKLGDAGREVSAAARRLGVPLTAGVATQNPMIESVEAGLSQMPFGRTPVVNRAEEMFAKLQEKASDIARQLSGGKAPLTEAGHIGEFLKGAAKDASVRFLKQREALDDAFVNRIGQDTAIPIDNLLKLRQEWGQRIARAPKSETANYGKALETLDALIEDAGQSGMLPLDLLRKTRTGLFADIHNPQATTAGWTDSSTRNAEKILNAVRSDIYDAAESFGPDVKQALKLHDRYVRFNRAVNLPVLEQIEKNQLDERVLNYAMQATNEGSARLTALKRNLKPEEWDTVAGSVFQRLGTPLKGQREGLELGAEVNQFSPATFISNWANLSNSAKKTLFAGSRYKEIQPYIDDLVKVSQGIKSNTKIKNFSNTANAQGVAGAILGLTGFGAGYNSEEGFNVGASVAPTIGAALATRSLGRLIESKPFLDWATRTVSIVADNPNAWPKQLSRVLAIAELEPTLKPEVYDYYQSMIDAQKQAEEKKKSPNQPAEAP